MNKYNLVLFFGLTMGLFSLYLIGYYNRKIKRLKYIIDREKVKSNILLHLNRIGEECLHEMYKEKIKHLYDKRAKNNKLRKKKLLECYERMDK